MSGRDEWAGVRGQSGGRRNRKPCLGCGRDVAGVNPRIPVGGKGRVRHKCPHGRWCIAGDSRMKAGGWIPGDSAHRRFCPDCASAQAPPEGPPGAREVVDEALKRATPTGADE